MEAKCEVYAARLMAAENKRLGLPLSAEKMRLAIRRRSLLTL